MKNKKSLEELKKRAYLFKPRILFVAVDKKHNLYFYTNDRTLRHLSLKRFIRKNKKFRPLLDIKIFKEKLIVLNNTLGWDLKGDRDESNYLVLDHFLVHNAPIIEESIEKVLHWGHKMKKYKKPQIKRSEEIIQQDEDQHR